MVDLSAQTVPILRILSSFHSESQHPVELFEKHVGAYASEAYPALLQGKALTCGMTGTMFDAAPAPNVVVIDVRRSSL